MRYLVTGGTGFLGKGIVRALHRQGHAVTSLARRWDDELEQMGVRQVRGDMSRPDIWPQALADCQGVFHTAAKAGVWGQYQAYHRANVQATAELLRHMQQQGIVPLVYSSSPSVIFDGRDICHGNEQLPYPQRFKAYYPQTKAQAEKQVLEAHGSQLHTLALRPHLIWGPEDPHLAPRIIQRARQGRLRRLGRRTCWIDTVYIDNAVQAHVLAMERLQQDPQTVGGRAYFITQGEPKPLWKVVNDILAAAGQPPVTRTLPLSLAKVLAHGLEKGYRWLGSQQEPPLTPFVVAEMSTHHWFDLQAARELLGYTPQVSYATGMQRLAAWLQSAEAGIRK